MKDIILQLIKDKPKHFSAIIKRNPEMLKWVTENSIAKSDRLLDLIYSAIYQESNVCVNGNIKHVSRFSEGFVGCGPARTCQCTKDAISSSVADSKKLVTLSQQQQTNQKRESTMIQKYGSKYNSQRSDIKHIWQKAKISNDTLMFLTNEDWMTEQYITNQRSLVDIAQELNVYYGTVGEYCSKLGFTIRQRSNYSLVEKEIQSYITSLGVEVETSNWSILEGKEVDIFLPKYNIGIEINGLYWHSWNPSDSRPEDSLRHISKTNKAEEKNVDLLHITDYEWHNQKQIIQNMIKSKLGLNTRVYARKCTLSEVPKKEANQFVNLHHLQGHVNFEQAYGLYSNNELIMITTVGNSRFSKDNSVEILRVCSKSGVTVVGGLSKLISQIKKIYNKQLISYCSRDKSSGRGYEQAGMSKTKVISPGYFWTDGNVVISRYKSQKKNLKRWLSSYNEQLSESENMFAAGFRRFYNCGNYLFVY